MHILHAILHVIQDHGLTTVSRVHPSPGLWCCSVNHCTYWQRVPLALEAWTLLIAVQRLHNVLSYCIINIADQHSWYIQLPCITCFIM